MSIKDQGGITPLEGGFSKLKEEALSQAQQELSDFINKQAGEIQAIINQVHDTTAQVQDALSQAPSDFNSVPTFKSYEDIPDELKSKLPPNFYISEPEISKLTSYSKTLGEGHVVYAKVLVDGKDISKENNLKVKITQTMANHDVFEIVCPSEAFNESNGYPFENSKKHLGGRATIELVQFGASAYLFTGVITEITSRRENGYTWVILSGQAPTILLENGEDCQSYENMDLSGIVKNSTAEYDSDLLTFDIKPKCKESFHYTVQYKESDFSFLKRLASRYGEWFYYNGQKIVFGGIGGKIVEMLEEQDVYNYELKMRAIPQKFSYLAYGSRQAKEYTVDSENISVQEPINPFQFEAVRASDRLFSKIPMTLYNQSLMANGQYELEEAVRRQKEHRMDTVMLEARSNNPNVRLGDIVKLRAWVPDHQFFGSEGLPLESYLITEITHYHDGVDEYYNTFKAVPKQNNVPNYIDENQFPKCEEQSATVVDNNDPDGLSRIRVQFHWQKLRNEKSPWLRVTTPYAGEGKGMHVIPEVGEEVLVAFENGNAEKPVVLGAMFNGKGKSGHGGKGNYKKGMETKKGNKILFNDKEGSTILSDQGFTTMEFDGKGNSSIGTSSSQIIAVGGTKEAPEGQSNLKMDKDGNITLKANTNITLEVGSNKLSINKDGTIALNGETINIQGEKTKVIGTTETEVGKEGATPGMKIGENVAIKGEQVDIN